MKMTLILHYLLDFYYDDFILKGTVVRLIN